MEGTEAIKGKALATDGRLVRAHRRSHVSVPLLAKIESTRAIDECATREVAERRAASKQLTKFR